MEASVNICYRTLFNIKKKASIACNRSLEYADKRLTAQQAGLMNVFWSGCE